MPKTSKDRKKNIIGEIQDLYFSHLGNFNHRKPQNIQNTGLIDENSSIRYPNVLDQKIFDLRQYFEEYLRNPNYTRFFNEVEEKYTYALIEPYFDKLPKEFFEQLLIQDTIPISAYMFSKEALKKTSEFINNYCNTNKYSINLNQFCNSLTSEQLEYLSEHISSQYFDKNELIFQIISKKFYSKLTPTLSNQDKYNVLLQIHDFVEARGSKFNSFKASIELELLEKGVLLDKYDYDLFLKYLNNPSSANYIYKLTKEKQKVLSTQKQYKIWRDNKFPKENEVVSSHLRNFFLTKNLSLETFTPYFDANYLKNEFFKAKIYKGEESEEMIKFFGSSEYENIIKETKITLCSHNKTSFEINEPVMLDLDLKNIQTLFIKIFEINAENYYYSRKAPIDNTISLEGLITTHESTYSFNLKPQKLIRKQFELTEIPLKRGFYIIEFIGNGYSSRAIIKKGRLNLVTRSTTVGKMLFILNEKSEICKSEKSGVWFKDIFYKSDSQTGHITIPYMKQTYSEPCIIVHEDFAELSQLEVTEEKYQLKGAFCINHESIMIGNTAKVLFRPYLYINGRETNVENLKNSIITVKLTKIENDASIPITHTFDKFNATREKEIEVDIQIPPKLVSIELIFEADIKNRSKDKTETLKLSDLIVLDSHNEDKHFAKLFLRKISDDYVVSFLGKNGEPKAKAQIEFKFYLKTTTRLIQETLQTDEKGEIKLGKLNDVKSVKAVTTYLDKQISMDWTIPDRVTFSYPSNIDVVEYENIILPFAEDTINKHNISLIKIGKQEVIEDCFHKIKLVPQNKEGTRYNIYIENLQNGEYLLNLIYSNHQINISVHDGKYWENKNFIITSEKIIENTENRNPIYIKEVSIKHSDNQENLSDICIKLPTKSSRARVHLYAYQFLHHNINEFSNKINEINSMIDSKSTHAFKTWKNTYLSNRLLNEEIQYVFDRKYLERVMGNSLVKPSLLLKRKFLRETTTEDEEINQGESYRDDQPEEFIEKETKTSSKKLKSKRSRKIESDFCKASNYSDFHNFLAYSPIILANKLSNDSGEINIEKLPLSNYSHIQIIAFDERSVCDEIISLNSKEINKRDLTLEKPFDPHKTYSEIRKIECVYQNSNYEISDITSTEFKIIDSLEKILDYNLLVNPSFKIDWQKFSFLFKLNEMSEEDQKKNISNYFSHELNLFCYFKYPHLFELYIKNIIKFKSEKSFMDFFLLNDLENLKKFTRPDSLSKLNAMEKCLLIIALGKENSELAKNIKNLIFTIGDRNKLKGDELKRLFNIMMNMKIKDEDNYKTEMKKLKVMPEKMAVRYMARSRGNESYGDEEQLQDYVCEESNFNMIEKCAMKEMANECEYEDDIFEQAGEKELSDYDQSLKNQKNNLFVSAGKTGEYQETHFFFADNNFSLQNDNLFWYDFASHLIISNTHHNFLSKNVILQATNVIDLIFMLSVLDLPLTSQSHSFSRKEGRSLEIKATSNIILFTKEISETNSKLISKLMIAQNVVDKDNENNPDQIQIKEFLINKVYVHETIVTNISSRDIAFELIIQIPEGAIPVMNSEYTKTVQLQLAKFDTTNYKTYFYFPCKSGKFMQYPPNVAIDGIVVAKGENLTYDVVESISIISKESLDSILITGSKKDILDFFENCENIKSTDIDKVLWLLKERDFFAEFIDILRKKGIYNYSTWSFGFYHKDEKTVKEFLDLDNSVKEAVGPKFQSTLLKIDETNNYNIKFHLDYNPIFNARVHKLGQNNKTILNKELRETYENFITYLIKLNDKEIDSKCYIRLCYYLIIQDRIEDALKVFPRINTTEFNQNSSLLMQYDYIAAYLDFSIGYPDFKIAKEICEKYKNFPLTHWCEMFEEIEDQIIEYEGKEICSDIDAILDEEKKKKQKVKNVIEAEPKLVFTIENKSQLNISYSNISEIFIKFYLIDLEILFSSTPFIKSNSDDFSFVQPNFVEKVILEKSTKEQELIYIIPNEFLTKNLFIEVSSINKKAFDTYFSTVLKVVISENFGEIKVTQANKQPLNKVYVKVYAKMNDNSVKFYKDGYTDLRGKFNYIQLNTDQLKSVKNFAVFIMHDEYGSIIKECDPPANITRDNNYVLDYDNYDNYKKEARQAWRSINKKKL